MNSNHFNGISLGTLLTIVFVVLKLTGVIAWSWWWVFAPLWIPAILAALIVLVAVVVGMADIIGAARK